MAALESRKASLMPETRQRLREADRQHHLHPFTDHRLLREQGAVIVEGAKGSRLFLEGGIALIDAVAGLACVNIGYGREEMAEAAARAMSRLSYYHAFQQVTNPYAAELAAAIAARAPAGLQRVFFSNSGSEANETALKILRAYWRARGEPDRRIIIARRHSYHGATLATASLTGLPLMHEAFGLPDEDTHHVMAPFWYREAQAGEEPGDFGRRAADAVAEAIERIGPDRIAGVIAEPVQVTGGAIVPPATYWPRLTTICREYGIPLILDEVVTGMGRMGAWFAADRFGISPQIITLAKGLSSGYQPIGATLVSDEIASVALESGDGAFQHGFTTSAHPVAAAVALENLRILEREDLIARVNALGARLADRLSRLKDNPLVGEIRHDGLIFGIEIVRDKATRSHFPLEQAVCGQVANACLKHGVIVRAVGNALVATPPFVLGEDEAEQLVAALGAALDEVAAHLLPG
ncbi:MAG: aminotransferase class III-fold pyridoxal phosphate-dependent enzyme [Alphaproteobacteria bacterium]|nr:MAG: aminotransferase class III-fold pyridoxal phosphate-dependent enzyme [Alphaproteobacteria bacterium]